MISVLILKKIEFKSAGILFPCPCCKSLIPLLLHSGTAIGGTDMEVLGVIGMSIGTMGFIWQR